MALCSAVILDISQNMHYSQENKHDAKVTG
jgi:hypothetical protein